jgi:hypothetical protein
MSVSIANVNSTTDTFQVWLDKTNQVLDNLSTVVLTSASNTAGGSTSGNVYLNGILSANTITAVTALRGGTVASAANLAVTSNVVFSGANVGGSVTMLNFTSTNVIFNSTNTVLSGGVVNITSNVNFQSNTLFVTSTGGGRVGIGTLSPDATLSVAGSANVSGQAKFSGNVVFQANLSAQSNVYLSLVSNPAAGHIFFGNTTSYSLNFDGTKFNFTGANASFTNYVNANGMTSAANVTLTGGSYLVGDITGSSNTCARSVLPGTHLSGGGVLTGDITLVVNASAAKTASVVVARDANASFSANVVTANLSGTALLANLASYSNSIILSSTTYLGSIISAASTTVLRDANSSIFANVFNGVATTARYADLAEKYTTDRDYPVGTVLVVNTGDESECTQSHELGGVTVGVVSEHPAYLMNAEAPGQAVALRGRVPVRIRGSIKKGDTVVSYTDGTGTLGNGLVFRPFAVALETSQDDNEKLIECVIL